ncbi:cell cycle control cwc2-related protein [Cryptosporidium ryanae]|uniref:cell cycle control cwc2-related protein n=1 Tax=Cryptosporidium ryanae TaxID=515981 RepID=UPI00351A634A|nr:cell cycle control cwc2-related protein [Cryptosporidium ryanae]
MTGLPTEKDNKPTIKELKRPARVQSDGSLQSNLAYKEGGEHYNIWYGKYQYDYDKRGKIASKTKCNPEKDVGWTKADQDQSGASTYFCLYFAKGCCVNGSKCKYYHRIPTKEDDSAISPMYDVFGRERHAQHKDDMTGTGSFNKECKTIFLGDLYINRSKSNYLESLNKVIKKEFSVWGPIENIRIIPSKNIAFVRFKYRASAEFAKAAMENQVLFKEQNEPISVRWAYDDPNPNSVEESKKRNITQVEDALLNVRNSTDKKTKGNGATSEIEGFYSHTSDGKDDFVPSSHDFNVQKSIHRVERILENINSYRAEEAKADCKNNSTSQEKSSIFDVVI